jgi:hypothetical protein
MDLSLCFQQCNDNIKYYKELNFKLFLLTTRFWEYTKTYYHTQLRNFFPVS